MGPCQWYAEGVRLRAWEQNALRYRMSNLTHIKKSQEVVRSGEAHAYLAIYPAQSDSLQG